MPTTETPTSTSADAAQVLNSAQRSAAREARVAQAFSQMVAVLMRDPAWRHLSLADLEWLVLPPLLAGQFRVAHATIAGQGEATPKTGLMAPVALAIWARVSPTVDAQLSARQRQGQPAHLLASEWTSGDIPWLIVTAGHARALPEFIRQLLEGEFKDRPPRMLERLAMPNTRPVPTGTARPADQVSAASRPNAS